MTARTCQLTECDRPVPPPTMRRYCSPACKKTANGRTYYERHRETVKRKAREHLSSDRGQELTLLRRYGITLAEREEMRAAQGGTCVFCERTRLYVDHCHETGRFRGLLCMTCNVFLGRMGDGDPARINPFLRYMGLTETERAA